MANRLEPVVVTHSHSGVNPSLKTTMKAEPVMMRPDWAAQLLTKLHPKQRPSKQKKIVTYARDMAAGRWRLTHQGIAIDEDGYVTDGQNRLHACVKSGAKFPTWLFTNCPNEGMVVTDTGVGRNVNDAAMVTGLTINNAGFAAVARRMAAGMDKTHAEMSVQEVLDFVSSYRQGIDFAYMSVSQNVKGISQASVRAVIARAYYRKNDRNRIHTFGKRLIDGEIDSAKTDQAVVMLRNWLLDVYGDAERKRSIRRSPVHVYAVTEYALLNYIKGQRITQLLEVETEQFPLPEAKRFDE